VRYLCTRGSRETFVNGKKSDIFIVLCLTITNRSVGLLAQSAQTKNHGGARLPVSSGGRGLIGVLGAYFVANGLFKGGFTLFVIAVIFGGKSWVIRSAGASIGVAVVVAILVMVPLAILYRKERDDELAEFTKPTTACQGNENEIEAAKLWVLRCL
jgi:predicted phage tail protein